MEKKLTSEINEKQMDYRLTIFIKQIRKLNIAEIFAFYFKMDNLNEKNNSYRDFFGNAIQYDSMFF